MSFFGHIFIFRARKICEVIYIGIKRIVYLKQGMSFNGGITFFGDDKWCWDMLSWVRECEINAYYECRSS